MARSSLLAVLFLCLAGTLAAAQRLPPLTPQQMRQDLIYARDVWKPKDHSFSPAATREFDRIIDKAIGKVGSLDPLGFWMTLSRALAVSGNGHTMVNGDNPPFPGLPLDVWWFRDGLYIVRTQPGYAYLLGARIEKIGKDTPEQALATVTPYISGHSAWVRSISPGYLRIPALLHRLGMTDSDTETRLTVRLWGRSGSQQVSLPLASMPDPMGAWGGGALLPEPASQKGRWPGVIDSVKSVPLTYQAAVNLSSRWLVPDHRVLYIRSNHIGGFEGPDHHDNMADLFFSQIVPDHPKSVIVDLRFNSGGNFFSTILFAQALPKLLPPGGHIYVLVNGSTFSAAIITAAMLKEAGGSKVVLLGTPMGDDDGFWAEGLPVPLPHSRLELRPGRLFEDWGHGCHDMKRCYWANVAWGPKAPISLQPDEEISPTFAEYAAGWDPVLRRALSLGTVALDVNRGCLCDLSGASPRRGTERSRGRSITLGLRPTGDYPSNRHLLITPAPSPGAARSRTVRAAARHAEHGSGLPSESASDGPRLARTPPARAQRGLSLSV